PAADFMAESLQFHADHTPIVGVRGRTRDILETAPMATRICGLAAVGLVVLAASSTLIHAQQDLVARAGAIHQRVITLDTHNDIDPDNFTADCNYTMRLTTQVNLPKMKE